MWRRVWVPQGNLRTSLVRRRRRVAGRGPLAEPRARRYGAIGGGAARLVGSARGPLPATRQPRRAHSCRGSLVQREAECGGGQPAHEADEQRDGEVVVEAQWGEVEGR